VIDVGNGGGVDDAGSTHVMICKVMVVLGGKACITMVDQ
jgi:hypothetical protein